MTGAERQHTRVELRDGVALLTLRRPDARNALDSRMRAELRDTAYELASDGSVQGVIVTGAGSSFCSGGDLKEMHALRDNSLEAGIARYLHDSTVTVLALRSLGKPLIAAVNGPAVGAGFGLALLADLRVVASDAWFAAPFVERGLMPDWGLSYSLPRYVGLEMARFLLLSGSRCDAESAQRAGFATRVVPPEELVEASFALMKEILVGAPTAVGATLYGVDRFFGRVDLMEAMIAEAYEQGRLRKSEEHLNAVQLFVEGR